MLTLFYLSTPPLIADDIISSAAPTSYFIITFSKSGALCLLPLTTSYLLLHYIVVLIFHQQSSNFVRLHHFQGTAREAIIVKESWCHYFIFSRASIFKMRSRCDQDEIKKMPHNITALLRMVMMQYCLSNLYIILQKFIFLGISKLVLSLISINFYNDCSSFNFDKFICVWFRSSFIFIFNFYIAYVNQY